MKTKDYGGWWILFAVVASVIITVLINWAGV